MEVDDSHSAPLHSDLGSPGVIRSEPLDESDVAGEGWSGSDIEAAYLKALSAIESTAELSDEESTEDAESAQAEVEVQATVVTGGEGGPIQEATPAGPAAQSATDDTTGRDRQEIDKPTVTRGIPVLASQPLEIPGLDDRQQISPTQVIEAALFVGGGPLTARRLCALLRGTFEPSFIDQTIDAMNQQYAAEARPYEIRLGDGGYRMELRPEHERIRNRVYGVGPREVRLSQEALEVLAFVAYKQPVTRPQLEAVGQSNAGTLLRQLLRRELIALERGENGRDDVSYVTTARFLSLFGLGSLNELPQPEDVDLK